MKRKIVIVASVVALIALGSLWIFLIRVYEAYGSMNVELAIIGHLERNPGEWPNSWDDLKPYFIDPVLPFNDTRMIEKFYTVDFEVSYAEVRGLCEYVNDPERDHGVLSRYPIRRNNGVGTVPQSGTSRLCEYFSSLH
jgi:hypothetical protein